MVRARLHMPKRPRTRLEADRPTMDITALLARHIATVHPADIPDAVRDEAVRALVDWLGYALGGSLAPPLDSAFDALGAGVGAQQATLIGRGDRTDILGAAFLGAIGAGALDYDAVHVPTRTRVVVPVAAALFAAAEARGTAGTDVVHAFILGVETACRIALALGDDTRKRGWNTSSLCGVMGAAAGCARLLGLDAARTACALGIAATSASGLADVGAVSESNPDLGFAARNGLRAALLAQHGFNSAAHAIEGARGMLHVLGATARADIILDAWGLRWEFRRVGYKPYACNSLLHPVIDACLQLRLRHGLKPRSIAHVDLRVHPDALAGIDRHEPLDVHHARRSAVHAAAVALFDGAAGTRQFQAERVRHGRIAELRRRVIAIADPDRSRDEALATIALQDGRVLERSVRCAVGSLERPMSDADLSDKFRALAAEVLATGQAERVLALAWNIRALGDVGSLIRATVPEEELEPAELPGSPLIPR